MNNEQILSLVDHTLLKQDAKLAEIFSLCDDALIYNTATVCIPTCYVRPVKEKYKDALKICTVIGFPNGNCTSEVKCFETSDALKNGADEIDMVINVGFLKDKRYDEVLNEINSVKNCCSGKTLKVIVETCLLSYEEKIKMCEIVSVSKADYIKTSTGFSTAGATVEDILLFKKYCFNNTKIKAAGGISSFSDAEKLINAGASRLGTSRLVKLMKNN